MEFNNLILETEGNVAILKINRPQALNALNGETLEELVMAVEEIESNPEIKAVVLTGEGKAFVAGADIKQMSELTPLQAMKFAELGHGLLEMIEASRMPYVAAVNGFALGGGCEIMMACDVAYASTKAKLGQPEINLGISPGFGGTQRLPRHIGRMKAKELLLTGDTISAQEAFDLGLVNKVFEPEVLMDKAMELATKMASKSGVQLDFIKALVNKGVEMELASANTLEISYFSSSFSTHDQKEGMKAFIEKRKAEFKDE